jgi:ADP-heptose:LPS heptosyltransferase
MSPEIVEGLCNITGLPLSQSVLPPDWTGSAIAIVCPYSLGDSIVCASLVDALKKKTCFVQLQVPENFVPLFKALSKADEVCGYEIYSDHPVADFDFLLSPKMVTIGSSGGTELIDDEYYSEAWRQVGLKGTPRPLSPSDLGKLSRSVQTRLPDRRPLVGIHMQPSDPDRGWHVEGWRSLIEHLHANGFGVVLFNDPTKKNLGGWSAGPNVVDLGQIAPSLVDQVKVLRMCNRFIGVDSAFAHIAGCLSIPGGVIFTSASSPSHVISRYPSLGSVVSKTHPPFKPSEISGCNRLHIDTQNSLTIEDVLHNIPSRMIEVATTNLRDNSTPTPAPIQPNFQQNILVLGTPPKFVEGLKDTMEVSYKSNDSHKFDLLLTDAPSVGPLYKNALVVRYDTLEGDTFVSCPSVGLPDKIRVTNSEELRKEIHKFAGMTWPKSIREGIVQFSRKEGLGDLVMASPTYRKVREMFPEAHYEGLFEGAMCDILADSVLFDSVYDTKKTCPPLPALRVSANYHGCWRATPPTHACVAMGGSPEGTFVEISESRVAKINEEIRGFAGGSKIIGFAPYQAPSSLYKTKEAPVELWRSLIEWCKSQGWKTVQLGAPFEKDIPDVDGRFRYKHVLDSFASFSSVDCVVTIDCLVQHACAAMGYDSCVVLWGGSSDVGTVGYSRLKNVHSDCKSSCYASVCASEYLSNKCCGDRGEGEVDTRCMINFDEAYLHNAISECLK